MRIGDDVAWTAEEMRVVAFDLTRPGANPFVLESSAAAVWEEIAEGGPLLGEVLLQRIAESFDIDESEISDDVEALLDALVSRDLLAIGADR